MKAFKHCGPNPLPMTKNEAITLAECTRLLPASPVIVQIGAYIGASTIAMLESKPDAFIFSVDVKPWREERHNIIDAGLDVSRVVRVLGDSSQIDWPYPIDLLYIDGDHRYDGVKADCEAWLEKVNGYVLFHDYIPVRAPLKNQVYQVVTEVLFRLPSFQAERLVGFEIRNSG